MELRLNIENIFDFFPREKYEEIKNNSVVIQKSLQDKTCLGNDYLGWLNIPESYNIENITVLKETAGELSEISDVVVVIGIGGSYLGARAVIESLTDQDFKGFKKIKSEFPKILYAGNNISEDYLYLLVEKLKEIDYSIVVISKSGTTTEPAIAFRVLKKHLELKYGKKESSKRIVTITDKKRGALKRLSEEENYKTFIIPDDVGGRFSVLTPVGLLPIAIAGIDINEIVKGALFYKEKIFNDLNNNISIQYAALRNLMFESGKYIEILANYNPKLHYISEWWKQLFGESEGKEGKGIFPVSVDFTTDLHSLGQIIQEGMRNIFETVIWVENTKKDIIIEEQQNDLDELNYLSGKKLNYINKMAMLGTGEAHKQGGVPIIKIEIETLNENLIGQLLYFFQYSCAISGLLLGVNPFNQPGVEAYKNNMFRLLKKTDTKNLLK